MKLRAFIIVNGTFEGWDSYITHKDVGRGDIALFETYQQAKDYMAREFDEGHEATIAEVSFLSVTRAKNGRPAEEEVPRVLFHTLEIEAEPEDEC